MILSPLLLKEKGSGDEVKMKEKRLGNKGTNNLPI